MKLKESSMNSLKWDTGTKAWQFDGKTPDLADICGMLFHNIYSRRKNNCQKI